MMIEDGDLDRAESVLMKIRSQDPNRDLPRKLHLAFVKLFRAYSTATPNMIWPYEALAALHSDAEEWEECLRVCDEAAASNADPAGQLSNGLRMRRLHAARAAFRWEYHQSTGDATFRDFVRREAVELATSLPVVVAGPSNRSPGTVPPLPPFTALSLPLSPEACSVLGAAYLARAINAAAHEAREALTQAGSAHGAAAVDGPPPLTTPPFASPPLPPRPTPPRAGEALVVGFLTPDANGAHPLGQLMAGTLRHVGQGPREGAARPSPGEARGRAGDGAVGAESGGHHRAVLFALCRDDGSAERRDFEVGAEVVDVTAWRPWDIAAEARRKKLTCKHKRWWWWWWWWWRRRLLTLCNN
jgi:hypothetical protein